MKKTIKDFNLNNKKVIIRVDFNVPIKDNKIVDDNRILASIKTIKYAISNNAKVILMSHLGRIKSVEDEKANSLKIVVPRLSELLNKDVIFSSSTRGSILEDKISKLNPGDVLLMENTRYEDLDLNLESGNDKDLGKYWASLGDIFINDAFGTSHRSHASNVGIATNLPSGIGFLIEEELSKLSLALNNPKRPYALILGGAKVKDKIGVIKNLVNICESVDGDTYLKKNHDFSSYDIGYDIGIKTIEKYMEILSKCDTIVWNGPMGMFENSKYANGTKKLLDYLSKLKKTVIIGGGDTASAAINFGYKDSFTHISTGGGASLELLEGKKLPGIDIIDDK